MSEALKDVITVGLDGSPESLSAVLWAAHEAQLRQARPQLRGVQPHSSAACMTSSRFGSSRRSVSLARANAPPR